MDAKLKQRVIGAVVLTALAIIILPMVLDGSSEDRQKVVASIPESPKLEFRDLEVDEVRRQMNTMAEQSAAKLPQPASKPSSSAASAAETTVADEQQDFALDEDKLPVSWALQVGSFREQEHAVSLRKSLRESGYRSYIIQASTEQGETWRVFVGPMVQKQRLQTISEEIENTFDLKGMIVRYDIEDAAGQLGG